MVGLIWVLVGASVGIISSGSLFKFLVDNDDKPLLPKKEEFDNNVIDVDAIIEDAKLRFDPEKVRKELKNLGKRNPRLEEFVRQCIKHLDTMDALQESVERMQKSGFRGDRLANISEALDDVEQQICQNMQDIITICIAGGSLKGNMSIHDVDQEGLQDEFASNAEKLAKVKELVRLCGKYVTQKDTESSNVGIESWISTLETLTDDDNDTPFKTERK